MIVSPGTVSKDRSMERLPVETALTAEVRRFGELRLPPKG
jgi:hypothetical protein